MKLGLRPVVYEADRIGGRLRSQRFQRRRRRDRRARRDALPAVLDDALPLFRPGRPRDPAVPQPARRRPRRSTVIELDGRSVLRRARSADLPPLFHEVAAGLARGARGGRQPSAPCRRRSAARDVAADQGDLGRAGAGAGRAAPSTASSPHRTPSGRRASATARCSARSGFGTGGWDTDFPNSMLEILRVVYTDADEDHRTVVGGVEQLPLRAVAAARRRADGALAATAPSLAIAARPRARGPA